MCWLTMQTIIFEGGPQTASRSGGGGWNLLVKKKWLERHYERKLHKVIFLWRR